MIDRIKKPTGSERNEPIEPSKKADQKTISLAKRVSSDAMPSIMRFGENYCNRDKLNLKSRKVENKSQNQDYSPLIKDANKHPEGY